MVIFYKWIPNRNERNNHCRTLGLGKELRLGVRAKGWVGA